MAASSWSNGSSARAMTRSAKRSAPVPEVVTNDAGGRDSIQVKPGRHREASLYHALAGAGAGNGRTLEQLREAALKSYETSELPVWRRSGFWTTSLQTLDLDALETAPDKVERKVIPEVITRT